MSILHILDKFSGNSISEEELKQKFGTSKEIMKSVACTLEGRTYSYNDINISNVVDVASQVAGCAYEYGTGWGKQVFKTNILESF